ncbi:MAG: hypothetical protein QF489_03790 [Planctomycetota bacterium]|jgi:hypothetical protein|nr:hypothetical protein [Planctomycetota bacterium]
MSKLASAALSLLLLAASCGEQEPAPAPQVEVVWRAVLDEQLKAFAEDGLPEVSADQISDYLEAMELAAEGGQMGTRFHMRLEEADPLELSAALLAIVENRDMEAIDKARAYAWLRARGSSAMMPRLTLRLKYEKDWVANVDIALALLQHGSGAGLQAFQNILATEDSSDPDTLQQARFRTMKALAFLPPSDRWQPGDGFDADWRRLLEVQAYWVKHRRLPNRDANKATRDQRAETWRTLSKLISQRLRPVDDARFVLVRMPEWAFEPIIETSLDQDRYVREHALQTLAWIGYPVGRWAREQAYDLQAKLQSAIGGGDSRARLFEAMGASGLNEMQGTLLQWLKDGSMEEMTAAADALLRCAGQEPMAELSTMLTSNKVLSPEARYSLALLFTEVDAIDALDWPQGLDSSEAHRRRLWRLEREDRP